MLQKLKSRKFLATLLTNIISVATLFNNSENESVQIIAIIVIALANIIYSIVEGNIDAKSVVTTIKEATTKIDEKLEG